MDNSLRTCKERFVLLLSTLEIGKWDFSSSSSKLVYLTTGTPLNSIRRTHMERQNGSPPTLIRNYSNFSWLIVAAAAVTRCWLDLEDRDTTSLGGTPPWVAGWASLLRLALSEVWGREWESVLEGVYKGGKWYENNWFGLYVSYHERRTVFPITC